MLSMYPSVFFLFMVLHSLFLSGFIILFAFIYHLKKASCISLKHIILFRDVWSNGLQCKRSLDQIRMGTLHFSEIKHALLLHWTQKNNPQWSEMEIWFG